MEPSKFDELTKALATSTSRRHAIKTIAAAAIGGLLGLGGIGTAFAKCHPNGIGCNIDSQCCSGVCCGTCTNTSTDPNNCGACRHKCTGTTPGCCNGTCVDFSNDPNNCGSCGNSCNGTTPGHCHNGTCVCFGLEIPCTSNSQCCDTGQGVTICGAVICCNNAGGQCIDDPDCCGTLSCTLGFCA